MVVVKFPADFHTVQWIFFSVKQRKAVCGSSKRTNRSGISHGPRILYCFQNYHQFSTGVATISNKNEKELWEFGLWCCCQCWCEWGTPSPPHSPPKWENVISHHFHAILGLKIFFFFYLFFSFLNVLGHLKYFSIVYFILFCFCFYFYLFIYLELLLVHAHL